MIREVDGGIGAGGMGTVIGRVGEWVAGYDLYFIYIYACWEDIFLLRLTNQQVKVVVPKIVG